MSYSRESGGKEHTPKVLKPRRTPNKLARVRGGTGRDEGWDNAGRDRKGSITQKKQFMLGASMGISALPQSISFPLNFSWRLYRVMSVIIITKEYFT